MQNPADNQNSPDEMPVDEKQAVDERTLRRARAAQDALRTLVRDLFCGQFGQTAPAGRKLHLKLNVSVDPSDDWALEYDPPLLEQLQPQMDHLQAEWSVFQTGRIYCFRCQSPECEHSRPGSNLEVFRGYSETGCPEWTEFSQLLIESHDERVDQLYEKKSKVLARFSPGRDLQKQQLSSFGRSSKTYSLLGQVAAGWFQIPMKARKNDDVRLAVTWQIAEIREGRGMFALRLNRIAALPNDAMDEWMADGWCPAIKRAERQTQQALKSIEKHVQNAWDKGDGKAARRELGKIPMLLRRMAASIEKGGRQAGRRTRHAEQRREKRPVHKAWEETRAAQDEQIFFDRKTKAIVVQGEHGRFHVFSVDGKHITTFVLKQDSFDFRQRTKRWVPIEQDQLNEFRQHIDSQSETTESGGAENSQ